MTIAQMMEMQDELQARYAGKWTKISPENGHFSVLWMMEEIGEIVAILKKRGNSAVMEDKTVRAAFVEECADVMMYYLDLLESFGVTPEEFEQVYRAKHERNMDRDFIAEHDNYLK